jgi:endonuclease YncB( thermonuclease family)
MIRLALLLLMLALPARAQVAVIDGDTIKLNGLTYRLWGIDAPELSQTCGGWIAGEYAAAFLRQIIEGREVTCEPKDIDRYGRWVALCRADNWDLGAWMVREGMAHVYTEYSGRFYEWHEEAAKGLQIGIHGARCKPAWQYRQEKKKK